MEKIVRSKDPIENKEVIVFKNSEELEKFVLSKKYLTEKSKFKILLAENEKLKETEKYKPYITYLELNEYKMSYQSETDVTITHEVFSTHSKSFHKVRNWLLRAVAAGYSTDYAPQAAEKWIDKTASYESWESFLAWKENELIGHITINPNIRLETVNNRIFNEVIDVLVDLSSSKQKYDIESMLVETAYKWSSESKMNLLGNVVHQNSSGKNGWKIVESLEKNGWQQIQTHWEYHD